MKVDLFRGDHGRVYGAQYVRRDLGTLWYESEEDYGPLVRDEEEPQALADTIVEATPTGWIDTEGRELFFFIRPSGLADVVHDMAIWVQAEDAEDWDSDADEIGPLGESGPRADEVALPLLAKLNAAQVRVSSPVAADGSISIVRGDDYASADGRALSWTVEDWSGPDLETLSIELRLLTRDAYEAETGNATTFAGSVVGDGDDAVFSVPLSAAETAALEGAMPGQPASKYNYVYQLVAIDEDAHVITIALGACGVARGV